MSEPDEAKARIAELVRDFQARVKRGPRLNERQTGTSFIEPLFEALGWQVRNPEEAPHRDLNNPDFKKQAVTYAYNKGVNWAVLTNFSHLLVFNAETERQFLSLNAESHLDNFDKLWLLSKEAFVSGAFPQEAQLYGAMQPRLPVEKSLFDQLRQWREDLFNQIFKYNPGLAPAQVDELIQQLLNRLIFIRTAEDRGLEENRLKATLHQWKSSGHRGHLIEPLRQIFLDFALSYDSELFPVPDRWTPVFIDDPLLENILNGLYDRPGKMAGYDFRAIDADVLGAVYEQYLGHVAEVVKERARQAARQPRLLGQGEDLDYELVAKKERRKAQGIYYTPKWVVDYIVRQTVGRLIEEHEGRDPNAIHNMTILDPACGSGSFLIRAYDELLRYHAHIKGKTPADLDWAERIGILTRNIFGVDLDDQAVQIARLNLLLRALDSRETLPPLAENIRRGNSLISGTPEELRENFGDTWREKHAFDWKDTFPDIMDKGGFDVVIGNPPYVRIQSLPEEERNYFRDHFETPYGSFDIYLLFIEQAIHLLKPGGRFGFITSGKFLKSTYGKKLCQHIYQNCTVEEIIDLSTLQVFAQATTYPVLLIFHKGKEEKLLYYSMLRQEPGLGTDLGAPADRMERLASQDALLKGFWPPPAEGQPLMQKLFAKAVPLKEVAERIFVGLQTSADKVYIIQRISERDKLVVATSSQTGTQHELESAVLKPLLSGSNIQRYIPPNTQRYLLFPYRLEEGKASLIKPVEFEERYPKAWAYLCANREALEGREGGKMRHEQWYAYVYPKNLALHDQRKLAIPRLVHRLHAFYDTKGKFYLDNVDVGGLLLKQGNYVEYCYIVGLLNSRLLDFCHKQVSVPFRGGFRSANRQFLEPLPVRRIDFANPGEKAMHDRLVALVERMLDLNRRKADKLLPQSEQEDIQREIARTDEEIDNLVYDLYGLTEEERRIVQEGTGRE
ncbi:MAG: N-6 DNA methylase [Chloroflexi bacterium]|nr:N-6 DNA methylase [Chloroflexota bacterium]